MRPGCRTPPSGPSLVPWGAANGNAFDAAMAAVPYFPGSDTAAAAGALLGMCGTDFVRPSRLAVQQQAGVGMGAGAARDSRSQQQQQQQTLFPFFGGLAPGSQRGQSRSTRSRSYTGYDSSTFPLHIL